jgi:hypothetical protein
MNNDRYYFKDYSDKKPEKGKWIWPVLFGIIYLLISLFV